MDYEYITDEFNEITIDKYMDYVIYQYWLKIKKESGFNDRSNFI